MWAKYIFFKGFVGFSWYSCPSYVYIYNIHSSLGRSKIVNQMRYETGRRRKKMKKRAGMVYGQSRIKLYWLPRPDGRSLYLVVIFLFIFIFFFSSSSPNNKWLTHIFTNLQSSTFCLVVFFSFFFFHFWFLKFFRFEIICSCALTSVYTFPGVYRVYRYQNWNDSLNSLFLLFLISLLLCTYVCCGKKKNENIISSDQR